ncbi:hypothetical protein EU805_01765 [Salipiger sp. IMCC34102]|uniref:hypothetical protein n=1 Tax=Salipiger sp. IMCC34102 TaxID=2510647 RepID=UPI00101C7A36|nr:hypothetical protein [Salipiger sp. IMCC34102]RYH04123.1 hypothetical protein EU805_01765 [Salipiger sp. IMCC34102]
MADKKKIELKLTSAVGINGKLVTPGKDKAKPDVVVSETVARNLLQRGKAKLFGDEELEGVETNPDGSAVGVDLGAKEGFPPPGKDAQNRSGSPLDNGANVPEKGANETPGEGSGAPSGTDAKATGGTGAKAAGGKGAKK